MKKLQKIELYNYRALYGKHKIDLKGKNLMIYGENGSGKSSICLALHDFIEATKTPFVLAKYENKFVTPAKRNSGYMKLWFKDTSTRGNSEEDYMLSVTSSAIPATGDFLKETEKLKGFLDYRSLLKTHFLKGNKVDLFELLIKELLYFCEDISNQTIGSQWKVFEDRLNVLVEADRITLNASLEIFSTNLRLFLADVETKANEIIDYFEYSVKIHLDFDDNITAIFEDGKFKFKDNSVFLRIDFHTLNRLPNHTSFLNEARLTAIATAIY